MLEISAYHQLFIGSAVQFYRSSIASICTIPIPIPGSPDGHLDTPQTPIWRGDRFTVPRAHPARYSGHSGNPAPPDDRCAGILRHATHTSPSSPIYHPSPTRAWLLHLGHTRSVGGSAWACGRLGCGLGMAHTRRICGSASGLLGRFCGSAPALLLGYLGATSALLPCSSWATLAHPRLCSGTPLGHRRQTSGTPTALLRHSHGTSAALPRHSGREGAGQIRREPGAEGKNPNTENATHTSTARPHTINANPHTATRRT